MLRAWRGPVRWGIPSPGTDLFPWGHPRPGGRHARKSVLSAPGRVGGADAGQGIVITTLGDKSTCRWVKGRCFVPEMCGAQNGEVYEDPKAWSRGARCSRSRKDCRKWWFLVHRSVLAGQGAWPRARRARLWYRHPRSGPGRVRPCSRAVVLRQTRPSFATLVPGRVVVVSPVGDERAALERVLLARRPQQGCRLGRARRPP